MNIPLRGVQDLRRFIENGEFEVGEIKGNIEYKDNKLYINEILVSNTYTQIDDDGEYSDYIEIYNGYKRKINLSILNCC